MADVVCAATSDEVFDVLRTSGADAMIADPALPNVGGIDFVRRVKAETEDEGLQLLIFSSREYSARELETMRIPDTHAFVKSRDDERDLVLRLRAVLTVRREPRALRLPAR
jgi:DNA-binding response OmpR family regulator